MNEVRRSFSCIFPISPHFSVGFAYMYYWLVRDGRCIGPLLRVYNFMISWLKLVFLAIILLLDGSSPKNSLFIGRSIRLRRERKMHDIFNSIIIDVGRFAECIFTLISIDWFFGTMRSMLFEIAAAACTQILVRRQCVIIWSWFVRMQESADETNTHADIHRRLIIIFKVINIC